MKRRFDNFADVIELWPSAAELARDLGVDDVLARSWKRRGIPSEYWPELVAAARHRGITEVTLTLLSTLSARRAGRKVPVLGFAGSNI